MNNTSGSDAMNVSDQIKAVGAEAVLNSLNDGLYVVDLNRRITYWSPQAEQITGWTAEDVVGKHCRDGVLCHIDKDGRQLCGEEHCPLHRAMVTNSGSTAPIVVFAQSKTGDRVPMRVSVAPIRDSDGTVIGGVETFRDLSGEFNDIMRAQRIQTLTLSQDWPADEGVSFDAHYVPADVVGGDYYAAARLADGVYGFMLADMTGHGVSAALYTMFLSSLWEQHKALMATPTTFCHVVNDELVYLFKDAGPFAATICGVVDLPAGELRVVGAGSPAPLVMNASGRCDKVICPGLPLGCMEDVTYTQEVVPIAPGDYVLLFSDGAIEVSLADESFLGTDGLVAILQRLGYPGSAVSLEQIEEEILRASDRIRFDDDLTLMEVRIR
jgi:sigma-B regulation protein RsbU (phosphoserine phosphatase)